MWSGKSYTEAVKTLSDAGFEVTFEGETTNSTVTAQDPKYGVSVEADSEVKITLTKKEAAEETGGGARRKQRNREKHRHPVFSIQ